MNDLFDFPSFDARQDRCTVCHLLEVFICFEGVKYERGILDCEALLRVPLAVLDKPVSLLCLVSSFLLQHIYSLAL